MRNRYLLLILMGLFCGPLLHASPLPLDIAEADTVWYRQGNELPVFVRFIRPQAIAQTNLESALRDWFQLSTPVSLVLRSSETDELGYQHLRYQQYRAGIPIEGAIWSFHFSSDGLLSMGGLLFAPSKNAQIPLLNQQQALQSALEAHPAKQYRWEAFGEAAPLGKLIWSPTNGNFQQSQLRLAYRFDLYSLNPFRRTINYIDALNGQLLWQEEGIHHIDSLGMAETAFSGARKIMTHYEDNRFRLADFTRGKGIVTLNAKNKFFWQVVGEDFWDEDNLWHNINLQRDEYATDAHWGTAQTYDFLSQVLGRNSIDDEGFLLISHIHVGENFRNAFWDGRGMYYGDGDSIGGTVDPLVSLDIVAHEIAHGLTQFTASLIYSNESGALNESFSDIMGKVVQRWSKPQSFDWIMGNEANFPIRNMSQPNDYNHPNTYQGNHWAVPGRVHTNSGVQNYWFFLLSEGGAGTNDNGDDFNLSGLGIDKATQIAFRSLIYYLHPSSTYEEARLYSVQAASDLYGACSPEVEQVIRAWYAVGVGPDYSLPVAEADFSLSNSTLCSPDREVQFTNLSRNGSSYRWDFGDGNSSEEFAPAHTYTEIGLYTVSLQLEGACGNDEKIINQAVEVLAIPEGPVISSLNSKPICGEEMALLAQGGEQIIWYDDSSRIIGQGESLLIPDVQRTETYYAQSLGTLEEFSLASNPPQDLETYSNGSFSQLFDVGELIQLQSLSIQALRQGNLYFTLAYPDRRQFYTREFLIEQGVNELPIDLYLPPGRQYRLSIRGDDIRTFLGTITELDNVPELFEFNETIGNQGYVMYDWQITRFCQSEQSPITIESGIPAPNPIDTATCGFTSLDLFVPAEGASVNWYNSRQQLIHQGEAFTTNEIWFDQTYFVEREIKKPVQEVGPKLDSLQTTPWVNNGIFPVLTFEVIEPVILESFAIYQDSGQGVIAFINPLDNQLGFRAGFSDSLGPGYHEIDVNWYFPKGRYEFRGGRGNMHIQTQNLQFPYEISDLISIERSSQNNYPFFFDWKVREASCWSERVPVNIRSGLAVQPVADFGYNQRDNWIHFQSLSKGADRYLWNFGDGTYSEEENPTHFYDEIGPYEVGLQVWFAGCTDYIQTSIQVSRVANSLQFYPNPASDLLTIEFAGLETQTYELEIFDLTGKRLFHEEIGEVEAGVVHTKNLKVSDWARGMYIVRLRSPKEAIAQKLLVE